MILDLHLMCITSATDQFKGNFSLTLFEQRYLIKLMRKDFKTVNNCSLITSQGKYGSEFLVKFFSVNFILC